MDSTLIFHNIISLFSVFWFTVIAFCTIIEVVTLIETGKLIYDPIKLAILFPFYCIYWIPIIIFSLLVMFIVWLFKGIMDIPYGGVFKDGTEKE